MNNARQMIVNLPVLTDNDAVDMIRVLTVITDAFIEHHQVQLQQQLRSDQPDLFEYEDELAPF